MYSCTNDSRLKHTQQLRTTWLLCVKNKYFDIADNMRRVLASLLSLEEVTQIAYNLPYNARVIFITQCCENVRN